MRAALKHEGLIAPVSVAGVKLLPELSPPHRDQTTKRWRRAVHRVLAHMQDHIDERQSSAEFAGVGAISRFHFNQIFRQTTGIPPAYFLGAMRLEMAKRLLLTTESTVTDICFEVGYSSLGTFTSRFTLMVGLSPSKLRRVAQSMEGTDLRRLVGHLEASPDQHGEGGAVAGRILVPAGFPGVFFLGLYDALLPHARPLRCTSLADSRSFVLAPVADGTYIVAAAGLHHRVTPIAFLDEGLVLRGASQPVQIIGGRITGTLELKLRPSTPFDPPILAPLPAMLAVL